MGPEHFAFGSKTLTVLDRSVETRVSFEFDTDDKVLDGDVDPMMVQPSGV